MSSWCAIGWSISICIGSKSFVFWALFTMVRSDIVVVRSRAQVVAGGKEWSL
jgi:hypothetical protein